jgi:hypothetical protein
MQRNAVFIFVLLRGQVKLKLFASVLQVPWNKSGLSSSYSGSSNYGSGKASDNGLSSSTTQVTRLCRGDMSATCQRHFLLEFSHVC